MDLDNKIHNDYYLNSDIIDELLKYYLNYDNILDKYKYPFEKIEPILINCNSKIKQRDFKISEKTNLMDFLNKSCRILGIDLSENTINQIEIKLEDEKYKYNYYVFEKQNYDYSFF